MAALTHGTFVEVVRANFGAVLNMNWGYSIESGRIVQMLGLFMIGLVLGRVGFFADPDRVKLQRRIILAVAIALAVPLYFYGSDTINSLVPDGPVRQNLGAAVDKWTGLAVAVAELLLFVEVFQSIARPLAGFFAAPGRMTLTLYVGQSVVFTPIYYAYGLGLYDDLRPWQCLVIGIVSFALQIAFAHLWFRRFYYGPLEWLWRAATRTSFDIPFLRQPVPAAA
jgi:uncharacterized protein